MSDCDFYDLDADAENQDAADTVSAFTVCDECPRFLDHAAQAAADLNVLLDSHLPLGVLWRCSQVRWFFDLEDLTVELRDEGADGLRVLATSDTMPRKPLDSLRQDLRTALREALDQLTWKTLGFGILLLQIAEAAQAYVEQWRASVRASRRIKAKKAAGGWDASKVTDWMGVLDNPHGVDLLSVNDTAKFVLGTSISKIWERQVEMLQFRFGWNLRLLHVEPVFRSDLVSWFLHRRKEMKDELLALPYDKLRSCVSRDDIRSHKVGSSPEDIAEYLSTPHVTFHGSQKNRLGSIVRYGFLMPGEKIGKNGKPEVLDIRCGASFGKGIYSSPCLSFAALYAKEDYESNVRQITSPADIPGLRIIVCAVLMGAPVQVSRDETRRTEGLFMEGAHSHVSPDKYEYIVFDKRQIIPCYVLNIDFGAESARRAFEALKRDPSRLYKTKRGAPSIDRHLENTPAAAVAKKAALKAAAAKWFPYGYGPATGTSFVIEEIAPVSDDEEEYGDFQALRKEQEFEIQEKLERDKCEKASWFDEFQTARETYQHVGM